MEDINQKRQKIKEAIIKAIAFFDIFDYPLTVFEIWQYSEFECSMSEILEILDSNELDNLLSKKEGFFFLKDRENIVKKRKEQFHLIDKKTKIALRVCRLLRFVNGVKMISLCNNFYYREESDIDLFIVIQKNRMWLTRLIITVLIHILGVRRHGKKTANRLCLSFYITEDNLNLKDITIEPSDIYFNYWLITIYPLYNNDYIYDKLIKENSWIKQSLPNFIKQNSSYNRRVEDNKLSTNKKNICNILFNSRFGDYLEKLAKKFQIRKMDNNKNSLAKENDSRVVISDKMLKFHEGDRRKEFQDKLNNKLKELKIKK